MTSLPIPTSNRAAVLYGTADIRLEERPVPAPGPGEVLVQIQACGICGSDVHYYREGRIGHYVVDAPMILGHESAGVVVATGSEQDAALLGRTVAIEPGVPCGSCEQCRLGCYNLCPDVQFMATPPVDGALTDLVVTSARFVHPAPEGMSAETAAMAEPLSVAIWANRKAATRLGDRVLVTGAGTVGQLTAQVARLSGATVEIFDIEPSRLDAARSLGFAVADASESTPRYDVLLECSGSQVATDNAVSALRPNARAVLVGMGAPRVAIDLGTIQGREITVTGTFRYAHTYPEALRMLSTGAVATEPLITHRFPLEQVAQALDAEQAHPDSIKVMISVSRNE